MSQTVNDTEEGVDYTYDDGEDRPGGRPTPGRPRRPRRRGLDSRQRRRLRVRGATFDISFYRRRPDGRGRRRKGELLASASKVPRGSLVRLYRKSNGDWAVEVSPQSRAA